MTDLVRRDARGLWIGSGNPAGRPKRVEQITDLALQEAPAAFRKIVELMGHGDPKIALAASIHVLDRAYGRPAQSVNANVQKLDLGQLYLAALKMGVTPPTIEGEKTATAPPSNDGNDTDW